VEIKNDSGRGREEQLGAVSKEKKDNTSYSKACSAKLVLPAAGQIVSGPTEHLLK